MTAGRVAVVDVAVTGQGSAPRPSSVTTRPYCRVFIAQSRAPLISKLSRAAGSCCDLSIN